MLTYTPADSTLSPAEHVQAIDRLRRESAGQWYCYGTDVFSLKAFGTGVQRFETPAWADRLAGDGPVKAYRAWLLDRIESAYAQAAG